MPRLTLILAALVGILAGGLAVALAPRPDPPVNDPAIRAIVAEMLTKRDAEAAKMSVPTIDPATLNPMIESFLMGDPKILQRVSTALSEVQRREEIEQNKIAIASIRDQIFSDPDQVVIGNPDGDVTLVEMFDYNCGYCRGALPDLVTLMAEDPNLKIVLQEFPILGQGSLDAAKIAILVGESDVDYLSFHEALFSSRGEVTEQTALDAAQALGLNPIDLKLRAQSAEVTAILQKSFTIADALKVSGTPTFIIGDEIIPGAIGIDELRERIANMRACGSTICDPDQG